MPFFQISQQRYVFSLYFHTEVIYHFIYEHSLLCMFNTLFFCFLVEQVQAQLVIKKLQEHMSISRAQMRLQISIPTSKAKNVQEMLRKHVQAWEKEEWSPDFEATVLVDPGSYRIIGDLLREETKGQASLEVLDLAVVEDNDEQLV